MGERLATQTLLKAGPGFTTILDVMELSAPGLSVDTEDITSHSSANFWRKFAATLIDAGEVTANVLWDPADATHQAVLTDLQAPTQRSFRMEFPGATTNARWTFTGYYIGFQPETPADEHMKANITIKLTDSVGFVDNV